MRIRRLRSRDISSSGRWLLWPPFRSGSALEPLVEGCGCLEVLSAPLSARLLDDDDDGPASLAPFESEALDVDGLSEELGSLLLGAPFRFSGAPCSRTTRCNTWTGPDFNETLASMTSRIRAFLTIGDADEISEPVQLAAAPLIRLVWNIARVHHGPGAVLNDKLDELSRRRSRR